MRLGLGEGGSVDGSGNGGSGGSAGAGDGSGSGAAGAAAGSGGASGAAGAGGSGTGAGAAGSGSAGAGAAQGGAGLGTAGADGKTWRDSLPDDLKADPTLTKYSDVQNLAKAHVELQKKFGQKGVFKPGKDASAEEIKSFREAMGIPTDPTKYDMGTFEGVTVPKETLAWAQKLGAEHGIDPSALKAVMTDYMKIEAENASRMSQAEKVNMQKGLDGLKTEWGDAYDRNLSRANFAAEKLGGKELVARLVELKVHNDPAVLKAFSEAAKLYGEDRLREAGAGDGSQSPQELDGRIAAVQGRLLSMKSSDGAYASVKQEYESLWRQKTRGK